MHNIKDEEYAITNLPTEFHYGIHVVAEDFLTLEKLPPKVILELPSLLQRKTSIVKRLFPKPSIF